MIFIMSYDRANEKLNTLDYIPESLKSRTYMVLRSNEVNDYIRNHINRGVGETIRIITCPNWVSTCSDTRRFIQDWCLVNNIPIHIQLDDDLKITIRRNNYNSPDWWRTSDKTNPINSRELETMFYDVFALLQKYPLVSILPRFMAGMKELCMKRQIIWGTRIMCFHGYNTEILEREQISLNRMSSIQDHDIHLQLIAKGHYCPVLTRYVHDQKFNAPGGCSNYRTMEFHNKNVEKLARLHDGLVTINKSLKKSGGEISGRLEPRINWSKAYNAVGLKTSRQTCR